MKNNINIGDIMPKIEGDLGYEQLNLSGLDQIRVCKFDETSAAVFHSQVMRRSMMDPMTPITVYIDSFGGSADALASMIETLESVPNKIITVCTGKAISCGAILLVAGDYRFCGRHSRVMIHAVSSMAGGDAYTIKTNSDEITRLNEYWLDFFAKKCKLSGYEELKTFLDKSISREVYFNATDAKEFGIVDEIGIPFIRPLVMFNVDALPPKPQEEKGPSLEEIVSNLPSQKKDDPAVEEVVKKKVTKKKVAKKAVKKAAKKTTKKVDKK